MRQTRDSIADIWGDRTPYFGDWPVRVDERIVEEPDRWVQSACVLCSNDCGMDIGVKDGLIVGVRGRAVDAVSREGGSVRKDYTAGLPMTAPID